MNLAPQIYTGSANTKSIFSKFKKQQDGKWYEYAPEDLSTSTDVNDSMVSFSLATLNVWFDAYFNMDRFDSSINNLKTFNPDIICLQEVTKAFFSVLLANPWIQDNYILSDVDGHSFDTWYGVIILVKRTSENIKFKSFVKFNFPVTKMGRSLISAHLMINSYNVYINTSHFESNEEDENVRKDQYETCTAQFQSMLGLINEHAIGILCGDFNIYNDEKETATLVNELKWTDAWLNYKNHKMEYTFGLYQPDKELEQRRIDRVLYRYSDPMMESNVALLKYFGNEPFKDKATRTEIYPSDHLGVYCKLEFLTTNK
eukprot:NODE_583_length_6431_cov_0.491788.p1 type:complete len:315 gc:universal NODE_583_length_6431_cov_0.491788:1673-2617(+)